MEWQCQIRSGKATLHIPFTGGTQTEYGVTPAKYSTANPVVQAIIERSEYYKRGRIVSLGAAKGKAAANAANTGGTEKASEEKAFATLADAKQWLADSCGVPPSGVRTIADAVAAAKSNGVALVIGRAGK